MEKKLWVLLILLIIAILISINVASNDSSTTGNSIFNKISNVFGLSDENEEGNTVGVLRGEIEAPKEGSVEMLG